MVTASEFSFINNEAPTRVVGTSTTLLDLIFVGPGPFEAKMFVGVNVFSDHESVFLSINFFGKGVLSKKISQSLDSF